MFAKFVAFIGKFFSREYLVAVGAIYELITQAEKIPADNVGWKVLTYAVAGVVAAVYMIIRTYQKAKEV